MSPRDLHPSSSLLPNTQTHLGEEALGRDRGASRVVGTAMCWEVDVPCFHEEKVQRPCSPSETSPYVHPL